ncbi:hypothetical protein DE146DRAFT_755650 [Phaeosphaeria sp. MPI-PUGE-AT-0046c]|nr:hypothetical protein DE146DRAFT_755650 [Phaeosphaeria sp. MPI-PUGE-AT-0046c]
MLITTAYSEYRLLNLPSGAQGTMILYILLVGLLGLTLACPPITNDTSTPSQGYFGPWFGTDKSGLWPSNSDGIHEIPYCYLNQKSFDKLSTQVNIGWAIWFSSIGSPSAASGHSLDFKRVNVPGGANPWCRDEAGNWNTDIPKHALVVYLDDDEQALGGTTTVGYTPDEKNSDAGRHWMRMGTATDWDYAHELGHAFGLLHEHQRPDRDEHVKYNCKMLFGYNDALLRAIKDGHLPLELCSKAKIANLYGFAASQFTKDGNLIEGATSSKEYDIHSIMHYTSINFADPAKVRKHPGDPEYLPLTKKENGGPKEIIPEPEPFPDVDVTELDVSAIKAIWMKVSSVAGKKDNGTGVAAPSTFATAVAKTIATLRQ